MILLIHHPSSIIPIAEMATVSAARWTSLRLAKVVLSTTPRKCLSTNRAAHLAACQHFQAISTPSSSSFPTRSFGTRHGKGRKRASKLEDEEEDYSSDEEGEDEDFVDFEIPFDEEPLPPTSQDDKRGPNNIALQSVINSGLEHLKATSTLISHKKETKKSLFSKAAMGEDTGPTKQQLAEANRILSVATRCLEDLEIRKRKNALSIGGNSILLLHAEVNANLREATLHWALPFEILMEADEATRKELTERMQYRIEHERGGSFLQGHVHRILSSYYPPKLKFKPASDVLLAEMLMM
ncbi:expressed unknown protein [Seminavis robusta]|uniref:Uncharacterized protein n=1 Tax=Seminavis robusta TaxID=568900 RepID=A0A9N8EXC2_9STRA|nr:expressed unknown protein [Seminavis robusta]|eukprot:Sro1884_g303500.1 n/a (297) ;mRNA; r:12628-13518